MKNYYLILITLGFIGCSTDSLEEYNEKTMEDNKINSDVEVITVVVEPVDPVEISEGNAKYEIIPIETLTFRGDTLTDEKLNFLIQNNFFFENPTSEGAGNYKE